MAKKEVKAPANKTTSKKQGSKAAKSEDKLSLQLLEIKETLEQEKDKFLRLFAEFENFKKRNAKERIELFKTANKEVLTSMIPVLDDFNRAQKQFETDEKVIDNEGFNLISNKFKEISSVARKLSLGIEEYLSPGVIFVIAIHLSISEEISSFFILEDETLDFLLPIYVVRPIEKLSDLSDCSTCLLR